MHALSPLFVLLTQAASNALTKTDETYTVLLSETDRTVSHFYGLGIKTQDQALFVEYPTDPDADYELFKGRVYEAVGVLSAMCFAFFALGFIGIAFGEEHEHGVFGPGYLVPMFGVLVVATIYRAVRVPGLLPGDGGSWGRIDVA
jgi:hypothetical protein